MGFVCPVGGYPDLERFYRRQVSGYLGDGGVMQLNGAANGPRAREASGLCSHRGRYSTRFLTHCNSIGTRRLKAGGQNRPYQNE